MKADVQLPLVHLNGTSISDLREGYDNAAELLRDFLDAYGRIEFNARDYYPRGPEAYTKAREQRDAINAKIREIREYIDAHREHLYSTN